MFYCRSWYLAEIQWRDLMNQDPPTHCVLFLSCDVVFEYISSKSVYFQLKCYDYFLIVKVVTWSQQVKCSISLPQCHHSKHPLSCHNGYVMLSRQLCDITMGRWHCHWHQIIMWPTAWIFLYNIQENVDILPKIQVARKRGYFTSKTGSGHTSQDKFRSNEPVHFSVYLNSILDWKTIPINGKIILNFL